MCRGATVMASCRRGRLGRAERRTESLRPLKEPASTANLAVDVPLYSA